MEIYIIVIIVVAILVALSFCGVCFRSYTTRGRVIRGPPTIEPNNTVYVTGTTLVQTQYPATTVTTYAGMPQPMHPPPIGWQQSTPYPPVGADVPPTYDDAISRPPAPTQFAEPYPKQQAHNPNY